ncbi:fatty acid desaturase family protein [Nocardiopsis ansamitocini]|uniref:Delta fatty acid desaturase n=1 Tax=Nocardiopsis ansamitocini TaxID=1670832 RepID=A0A9W6PB94_9ACTN|nr:acyl-CoA desaturase [Nocardiopsis ansamitocini]GLU50383.1 delta fatty acid desaturase [Nocardiopsis ansamitocini]
MDERLSGLRRAASAAGTRDRSGRSGSDFAELSRRVNGAGLLKRRPWYYTARFILVGALFVGGWTAFVLIGDSWWQILVAAFLAVVFTQMGLLAHDLAHRQIFRTRRPSAILGRVVGNLGIGMGYGWWMDKHTRHHANPNHEDLDPDVAPDALVWSDGQAQRSRGVPRLLGRWQAYLFFPLLTLEGMNLHVASVRALFRPSLKQRWIEAALLFAHFALYIGVLLLVLSPLKALVFLAVNQGLFGIYLGCVFAPNHKGMPTLTREDELDFLRKQVLTSRNVRGGRFVDAVLGGLNYQIEHHLFPSMATPNLRRAQPIVRDYCAELGVPYQQTGMIDSYAQALRHLHRVGAPIRNGLRSPAPSGTGRPDSPGSKDTGTKTA